MLLSGAAGSAAGTEMDLRALNAQLPQKVDQYTTLTKVDFDVERRAWINYYDLNAAIYQQPNWSVERLKQNDISTACEHFQKELETHFFGSVRYIYKSTSQSDVVIDVTNNDCIALAQEGSWLGVQLSSVETATFDRRTNKSSFYEGAKVESVVADSPATTAGLKEGDVILSIDGHETKDASQVTELVRQMPPGSTVHVKFKRNDADLELKVVLGRRPAPLTPPSNLSAQPDQKAPVSCRNTYEPRLGCY
jgi:C-terminal processing protease CtpA/Prc